MIRTTTLAPTVLAAALLATSVALAQSPSPYGADDEIGAANLLTPEVTLKASDAIRTGKTYQLAIVVTEQTQGPGNRRMTNTMLPLQATETEAFIDDYAAGHLSVGTQIDGLGHAIVRGEAYNGHTMGELMGLNGIRKLGVENIPPIATRGILLDIARLKDVDFMKAGEGITAADLEAAAQAQGVEIREGDVVLLRTGWMEEMLEKDASGYVNVEPGLLPEGGRWLAERGVVAVGLDVAQMDAIDVPNNYARPVHEVLLKDNGVYTLENVNVSELARDEAWEFFFVLGAIRYDGAAQTPVNPIAIR